MVLRMVCLSFVQERFSETIIHENGEERKGKEEKRRYGQGFAKRTRSRAVFFYLRLTLPVLRAIIVGQAGVLELADEEDSKSFGLITRAGSTPATGTNKSVPPPWRRALVATVVRGRPAVFAAQSGANTKLPQTSTVFFFFRFGGNSG